jgi:hypothetical protein
MDYIIGAGAILESGEAGSITPATLHAHVDAALAERVQVAAIDFESLTQESLKRLLILRQGWNATQFGSAVTQRLRTQGECSLADVLRTLASTAGAAEVHLFAHWLPDEATCAALQSEGIVLICHPLESIDAASLVRGQRRELWKAA